MSISVGLVCLGNICRSPMADVILQSRLDRAGLADTIVVASSGTGDWHTGRPMDERAAATLRAAGYDPSGHRARLFTRDWFADHDLLLAMDSSNFADMSDLAPTVAQQSTVQMYRSFDPLAGDGDLDVPDPYFGAEGGFEHVLAIVERTSDALVEHLSRHI